MKLFTPDNRLVKSKLGEVPAQAGKELGCRLQTILRQK